MSKHLKSSKTVPSATPPQKTKVAIAAVDAMHASMEKAGVRTTATARAAAVAAPKVAPKVAPATGRPPIAITRVIPATAFSGETGAAVATRDFPSQVARKSAFRTVVKYLETA